MLPENDKNIDKWFKPARGEIRICYSPDRGYMPDFVVEAENTCYLCEPKRSNRDADEEVQAKSATVKWCEYSSKHATEHGGKPWKYPLIAHDSITE
ncbi:MAG: hypothetical protein M2R46_04372 [Verrucomicrobia subdivision 3 bacterium]|nr:hypothetical protein [Limisphaerales bacterium]